MSELLRDPAWHARITTAVAAAEKTTDGEIVVTLTSTADDARDVARGVAAAVATALLGVIVLSPHVTVRHGAVLPLVAIVYVGVSFAARRFPLLRRIFTTRARRVRAAREDAHAAFFDEHVSALPSRAGVLLHVSLEDRLVQIVPDLGAESKVPHATWQAIAHRARTGRFEDTVPAAIADIGAALASAFPRSADRPNEHADEPRVRS